MVVWKATGKAKHIRHSGNLLDVEIEVPSKVMSGKHNNLGGAILRIYGVVNSTPPLDDEAEYVIQVNELPQQPRAKGE